MLDDDIEALDTEVVDWWSYQSDNYRFTADAADSVTASQPRWVVAAYWIDPDSGEFVYDALIEPTTLDDALGYQEHPELSLLISAAEATEDFQEREALVDQVGAIVREQIARFVNGRLD
jgi:hypothetical protein